MKILISSFRTLFKFNSNSGWYGSSEPLDGWFIEGVKVEKPIASSNPSDMIKLVASLNSERSSAAASKLWKRSASQLVKREDVSNIRSESISKPWVKAAKAPVKPFINKMMVDSDVEADLYNDLDCNEVEIPGNELRLEVHQLLDVLLFANQKECSNAIDKILKKVPIHSLTSIEISAMIDSIGRTFAKWNISPDSRDVPIASFVQAYMTLPMNNSVVTELILINRGLSFVGYTTKQLSIFMISRILSVLPTLTKEQFKMLMKYGLKHLVNNDEFLVAVFHCMDNLSLTLDERRSTLLYLIDSKCSLVSVRSIVLSLCQEILIQMPKRENVLLILTALKRSKANVSMFDATLLGNECSKIMSDKNYPRRDVVKLLLKLSSIGFDYNMFGPRGKMSLESRATNFVEDPQCTIYSQLFSMGLKYSIITPILQNLLRHLEKLTKTSPKDVELILYNLDVLTKDLSADEYPNIVRFVQRSRTNVLSAKTKQPILVQPAVGVSTVLPTQTRASIGEDTPFHSCKVSPGDSSSNSEARRSDSGGVTPKVRMIHGIKVKESNSNSGAKVQSGSTECNMYESKDDSEDEEWDVETLDHNSGSEAENESPKVNIIAGIKGVVPSVVLPTVVEDNEDKDEFFILDSESLKLADGPPTELEAGFANRILKKTKMQSDSRSTEADKVRGVSGWLGRFLGLK